MTKHTTRVPDLRIGELVWSDKSKYSTRYFGLSSLGMTLTLPDPVCRSPLDEEEPPTSIDIPIFLTKRPETAHTPRICIQDNVYVDVLSKEFR